MDCTADAPTEGRIFGRIVPIEAIAAASPEKSNSIMTEEFVPARPLPPVPLLPIPFGPPVPLVLPDEGEDMQ